MSTSMKEVVCDIRTSKLLWRIMTQQDPSQAVVDQIHELFVCLGTSNPRFQWDILEDLFDVMQDDRSEACQLAALHASRRIVLNAKGMLAAVGSAAVRQQLVPRAVACSMAMLMSRHVRVQGEAERFLSEIRIVPGADLVLIRHLSRALVHFVSALRREGDRGARGDAATGQPACTGAGAGAGAGACAADRMRTAGRMVRLLARLGLAGQGNRDARDAEERAGAGEAPLRSAGCRHSQSHPTAAADPLTAPPLWPLPADPTTPASRSARSGARPRKEEDPRESEGLDDILEGMSMAERVDLLALLQEQEPVAVSDAEQRRRPAQRVPPGFEPAGDWLSLSSTLTLSPLPLQYGSLVASFHQQAAAARMVGIISQCLYFELKTFTEEAFASASRRIVLQARGTWWGHGRRGGRN